jgi:predicted HTH domain antitoxin
LGGEVRQEPFDCDDDPEREELVRLAERATRDLGLSVPKLCFELRRVVLRRKARRTAELAGLPTQEMERILKEREIEKGLKRCI